MTIREFSIKHDIPYWLAYQCSFGVLPESTMQRNKDFSETMMLENLINIQKLKVRKAKDVFDAEEKELKRILNYVK